ncbi:hypothetical protein GGS20DRAFT_492308 [Poronia punctata]|nr:hypothetical protein GGS20DRAFT_492308 [Poronia punctata]
MSTVKFSYPPYKLFEVSFPQRFFAACASDPSGLWCASCACRTGTNVCGVQPQYHGQRPIIIDTEAIESPETVTLRYEEEAAARANGGDLRGDTPPGLLSIDGCSKSQPPPMHSFDSARSYQDAHYPYNTQPYATQQTVNAAAAQLNNLAFAANSSADQYITPVGPSLISYQPTSGIAGTKVMIKISVPYELGAVTSHFFVAFGSHRCSAHASRDSNDGSGYGYVVGADVPRLEDTRIPGDNVPISLLIESADGQTLASLDVGTFTYHDTQAGSVEAPHESVTRRPSSKSPEEEERRTVTPDRQQQEADHQLAEAAAVTATNTYGYAPTAHQAVASNYDGTGYSSNNSNSMLSTYHRSSYDYPRPPSLFKSPTWASSYAPSLSLPRSPPRVYHAPSISRSSVTSLPIPGSGVPQLVRTSTIQTSSSSGGGLNPYALYSTKAILKINGDLESMANNWTPEECENGRRLVLFSKKQQGSTLSVNFKPVSVSERPPNSICISCIYWAEKRECFLTSVDTISLLERMIHTPPEKFDVEEKNRIRRNLEGLKPITVSKAKPESEEFFKVIMGFPNPKPRNIEKDIKVFPWKKLGPALKKIIAKYSASPPASSGLHHHSVPSYHQTSGPSALLTPVSSTSPGLYGPPHTPTMADTSYSHHDSQSTIASPRSLSGAPSSWGPYSGRTLSPSLKTHSPQGMRMPGLPSYANNSHHHHSPHGYGLASHATHSQRWDTVGVSSSGYGDASGAAPAYSSHQHHSHVYGAGAYGTSGHHRE